jgi:hypothetical protein
VTAGEKPRAAVGREHPFAVRGRRWRAALDREQPPTEGSRPGAGSRRLARRGRRVRAFQPSRYGFTQDSRRTVNGGGIVRYLRGASRRAANEMWPLNAAVDDARWPGDCGLMAAVIVIAVGQSPRRRRPGRCGREETHLATALLAPRLGAARRGTTINAAEVPGLEKPGDAALDGIADARTATLPDGVFELAGHLTV